MMERDDIRTTMLDAEWDMEKPKAPVPRNTTKYHINMGFVWKTEFGEHRAVSTPIIELKQAMGKYYHNATQ